jgi:putative component of toxin-antitoxin plasmid stabilization module
MQQTLPRKVETYVTREGKDLFQGWLKGLNDKQAQVLIEKTIAESQARQLGKT